MAERVDLKDRELEDGGNDESLSEELDDSVLDLVLRGEGPQALRGLRDKVAEPPLLGPGEAAEHDLQQRVVGQEKDVLGALRNPSRLVDPAGLAADVADPAILEGDTVGEADGELASRRRVVQDERLQRCEYLDVEARRACGLDAASGWDIDSQLSQAMFMELMCHRRILWQRWHSNLYSVNASMH